MAVKPVLSHVGCRAMRVSDIRRMYRCNSPKVTLERHRFKVLVSNVTAQEFYPWLILFHFIHDVDSRGRTKLVRSTFKATFSDKTPSVHSRYLRNLLGDEKEWNGRVWIVVNEPLDLARSGKLRWRKSACHQRIEHPLSHLGEVEVLECQRAQRQVSIGSV